MLRRLRRLLFFALMPFHFDADYFLSAFAAFIILLIRQPFFFFIVFTCH